MGIGTIVLIILVLALVGVIPTWPHSRGWGYGPSGGVSLIVVVLLILLHDHDQADAAAWAITPAPAMWPGGNDPSQCQHEDDQHNRSDTHVLLLQSTSNLPAQ